MRWLVLLTLLLASEAGAVNLGTTSFLAAPGRTPTTGINSGRDARDVYICLIPDVQHMAAGKLLSADKMGKTCGLDPVTSGCIGAYCTKSPYCQNSWRYTTARELYNIAYELTGQWGRIDYTGINGAPGFTDNSISFRTNPMDHPRCDIIISLGDMNDQPTFHSGDPNDIEDGNVTTFEDTGYTSDPNALNWYNNSLSELSRHDWQVTEAFWRIIDDSGIPYLPTLGNHDTRSGYRLMMNHLGFQSKSYFYAVETTDRQAWAIKVPTNAGKPFCIITLPDGFRDANGTDDPLSLTAAEKTFLTTNIGCGGSFPTIIEQHGAVLGAITGPSRSFLQTTLQDANNAEVFGIVGGHYAALSPLKGLANVGSVVCGNAPGCAAQLLNIYANWQDMARIAAVSPQGNTVLDSNGGWYTMVVIKPQLNRIETWDWNTYSHSTLMDPAYRVPSSVDTVKTGFNFNFDARFP